MHSGQNQKFKKVFQDLSEMMDKKDSAIDESDVNEKLEEIKQIFARENKF